MPGVFHEDGIRFQYPDNWELTQEASETGWTVSVQSPATAFFLLSYDSTMPEVEAMAETALEALRAEYADLEADEAVESLAGQPAMGHDMRFTSLDLTNTCCTRSFYCETGTILVMWQANDLELDAVEPVMRAICASLRLDE